jgi:hypothetical protein
MPQKISALQKIMEDRQEIYGDAEDNFRAIGRIWGALLQIEDLEPHVVALMFDAAKSVRAMKNPEHEDSWLDKMGYTLHATTIIRENAKRQI